jgi:hypothetical protein
VTRYERHRFAGSAPWAQQPYARLRRPAQPPADRRLDVTAPIPYRGEKGSAFEGGWRVPGIMWWPNHIAAGAQYGEMMSHIDAWATLATMVGLTPPPHDWVGNDGKPIYFDSIDNSAYILGKAPHSARNSWVYIDGENFYGVRADIGGDSQEPWVHIAWKYLYTAKDSWLGATANLGAIGAIYNLTMDPYDNHRQLERAVFATVERSARRRRREDIQDIWSTDERLVAGFRLCRHSEPRPALGTPLSAAISVSEMKSTLAPFAIGWRAGGR